jgi:hypothetical protein
LNLGTKLRLINGERGDSAAYWLTFYQNFLDLGLLRLFRVLNNLGLRNGV